MSTHEGVRSTREQHDRYIEAQAKWAANEHANGSVEEREAAWIEMRKLERDVLVQFNLDPRYYYQWGFDGTILTGGMRGEYARPVYPTAPPHGVPDSWGEEYGSR